MERTIRDFKSFAEAEKADLETAVARSPQERLLLLHRLILAWMKFPKYSTEEDDIPHLKRPKGHGGNP